jgi:hypothetical protein
LRAMYNPRQRPQVAPVLPRSESDMWEIGREVRRGGIILQIDYTTELDNLSTI